MLLDWSNALIDPHEVQQREVQNPAPGKGESLQPSGPGTKWLAGNLAKRELSVWCYKLSFSEQCIPVEKAVNHILHSFSKTTPKGPRKLLFPCIWHLWRCIESSASSFGLPTTRKIWTSWSKSSSNPQDVHGAGAHDIKGRPWELLFSVEHKAKGRVYCCPQLFNGRV